VSITQLDNDYFNTLVGRADDLDFFKNIKTPEGLMAYCARVSSPNQTNKNYAGLLKYCAKHGHWSVFELVDLTFEIETSRAIAAQILRHRSFCFQEFSQRYSKAGLGFEVYPARRQDEKNRQNSIDDMSDDDKQWFKETQERVQSCAFNAYSDALDRGIAKEQARNLLPLGVKTRLYMKGSVRSWLHYVNLRCANGTQKEHADIAKEIKKIIIKKMPAIAEAMEWKEN